jgi:polar amino acid transport system substrate-binding protein
MTRIFRCVALATIAALMTIVVSTPLRALTPDLSPEQKERPRAEKVAEAIRAVPKDFKFAKDGVLTIGIAATNLLPLGAYATDTKTVVGNEADIAQIVADSLGLKLELVPIAWADWPLGLTSGKFDAIISNVTVTEARKEKFDFSTYRQDVLGFYVKSDNDKIKSIVEPKDVAGLKVIVSSGTSQEQILLNWLQKNKEAGLAPTELQYYDDGAVRALALQSGRADTYLTPNAFEAFNAAQNGKTRLVGAVKGGWPLDAEIAVATRKGSGLAEAVTLALNAQILNGTYGRILARWGLTSEAIKQSRTNPPGLPKS